MNDLTKTVDLDLEVDESVELDPVEKAWNNHNEIVVDLDVEIDESVELDPVEKSYSYNHNEIVIAC